MKKRITVIFLLVIAIVSVFSLVSCGPKEDSGKNDPEPSSDYKVVNVYVNGDYETKGISVPSDRVDEINYTEYFSINADGTLLEVKDEYIDSSAIKNEIGTYYVTCTFMDKSAMLTVHVNKSTFEEKVKITSDFTSDTYAVTDETWEEVSMSLASHFTITDYRTNTNGENIPVTADMIDYSAVSTNAGEYKVYCIYSDENGTLTGTAKKAVTIVMTEVRYDITLKTSEVTLNVSRVAKTDFTDYFKVKREDKSYAVTASMLEGEVKSEIGNYTLTLRKHNYSASLIVHVTNAHEIEIGKAYETLNLTATEATTHDFTKDFWVYSDQEAVAVTTDMIDKTALDGTLTEGETYAVTLSYDNDGTPVTKSLSVKIVPAGEIIVNARNEETYPNSEYIDLTTLFTITDSGEEVAVTSDMVSGSVDYTKAGTNTITMTYKDTTYTATVTVKTGAIVKSAKSDTINVRKGTDKSTYDFASDFIVIINGERYRDVLQYIDTSAIDFTQKGSYEVTITIPYNTKSISATGGVNFTNVQKTITYNVVDKEYSGSIIDSVVTVTKGTSYNLFSNLSVYINGYDQQFTEDPNGLGGGLTCYAEIVEGKNIDFDTPGVYEVSINVYEDGIDSAYHTLTYTLIINSNVSITTTAGSSVVGNSVYLPDLFTITEGDNEVDVTVDMITGEVDFFTPGVYTATVNYKDFTASTSITVFDNKFIGTYKTALRTIAVSEETDDEGGTSRDAVASTTLGDLTIDENMNITVHGTPATDVFGIDANTFTFNLTTFKYTMYFDDGIIVLIPTNEAKVKYSEGNRALVYFNTSVWTIPTNSYFAINDASEHILQTDLPGYYSIDCVAVIRQGEAQRKWYGLKVGYTKSSYNYYYDVNYGWVDFNNGGTLAHVKTDLGTTQTATFNGEQIAFTVSSATEGKIDKTYADTSYYGKTFTGSIDGTTYTLSVSSSGWPTLKKGSETVFSLNSWALSSQKFGGYNPVDSSYEVYGSIVTYIEDSSIDYRCDFTTIKESGSTCAPFAYKLILNKDTNKFTYIQKDDTYGLYTYADKYIFFDGYGNGIICFDKTSNTYYTFEYTLEGSEIAVTYTNTDGSFAYGTGAEFYIDVWKNIITVKRSDGGIDAGVSFENAAIESGAIVRVGDLRLVVPMNADGTVDQTTAKENLLSLFTIITKDGELTGTDKTSAITTKFVSFKTNGFYQVSVTLTVNGAKVTNLYSVQIIIPDKENESSPFYGKFNSVLSDSTTTFSMDAGKMITLNYAGTTYTGLAELGTDTLTCYAYSNSGRKLLVKGSVLSDNVIRITATGAEIINAYLTTGTTTYAGTEGLVIRAVKKGTATEYFVSKLSESLGEKVTVEQLRVGKDTAYLSENSILEITFANGDQTVIRIDNLGDYVNGLTLSNGPIGMFESEDGDGLLTLDGFNVACYNLDGSASYEGTYTVINDKSVLFKYTSGDNKGDITIISITDDNKFTVDGSPLALTDIRGSYSAALAYYGSDEVIHDTLTFIFNNDGSVTIAYTPDSKATEVVMPEYVGATAAAGKVTLKGDTLTVIALKDGTNYTFTFTVVDPLNPSSLSLTSCPALSDDYEGAEPNVGTVFVK